MLPMMAGFAAVVLMVAPGSEAGAQSRGAVVRVLAAGATESTLRASITDFEARSGVRVEVTYGGVGQLRDRLVGGEPADVLIVTPAILQQLEGKDLVVPGSRVDFGQVGGGIAVRAGAPRPSVTSPEELKAALLAADEIYFADPATTTAGAYLLSVADRLGVGAEVRRKGHTAPGGKSAMQLLARSRAKAIGVTQISEIRSVPEVVLVAPYPAPLQKTTTYAGVVLAQAAAAAAAQDFLRFLTTPAVQARFREAGFEPAR